MSDKNDTQTDSNIKMDNPESQIKSSASKDEKSINSDVLDSSLSPDQSSVSSINSPESADSVLEKPDSVQTEASSVLEKSAAIKVPKTEKELVLDALEDAFTYYNWSYSDKERLRYATVNTSKKQTKFYERFLFEGNLVFNLAVKLSARRKRLAK